MPSIWWKLKIRFRINFFEAANLNFRVKLLKNAIDIDLDLDSFKCPKLDVGFISKYFKWTNSIVNLKWSRLFLQFA